MVEFERATVADPLMAVSHFQLAHLSFMSHDYTKATTKYEEVLQCMRGNATVEYGQTGLEFSLYECEVWFNHGLCRVKQGNNPASALQSFMRAHLSKRLVRHDLVDEAIASCGQYMLPFAPPDLKVYRPKRMPSMAGNGSLLNTMTMPSAMGVHTPMPTNIVLVGGETQSRKVVAVVEGELRPNVYDFGTNMARLSISTFSQRSASPSAKSTTECLVKLFNYKTEEPTIRYTHLVGDNAGGLIERIRSKLGNAVARIKYSDDQGDWLSLIDDDDLGVALETSMQRLDRLLVLRCY